MSKIVYYSLDNIEKENALFNIIYGERSNGKSFQVKHRRAVEKYLETGKRFILMRRLNEEIKSDKIESYFADVDTYKLTKGKYNCITLYRGRLYFSNYNPDNKPQTVRGEHIGYVVSLSTEQNYAGGSYLDVEDIIFEEFMSRSVYLANEPDKLMNFYCTVDRKRGTTRLWLIGNTISRVCPYIYEWGLHKIVSQQKQGTIKTLLIDSAEGEKIKVAIEYCKDSGRSSHTIGKNKDMLNSGSWQTYPQPHLPKSKKDYKILFRIMFQYQNFKFIGEYLQDIQEKNNTCWFIYPYDGEIKNNILVFSDVVKISKYWQRNIYDMSISNDKIKKLLYNTFRESNIFYSDDLCGTDFKQVIDFEIKK